MTFDILKEKYGPVMTLEQVAETLSRPPESLRMAILSSAPWTIELGASKRYIGRRMYFPIEAVTKTIDGGALTSQSSNSKEKS
jgi:hypothetical protein